MPRVRPILAVSACLLFIAPAPAAVPKYDLSKEKVLYCIGYAHLDTQWRWDYPTTIDRFIKSTLEENFDRFEKHPGYVFNFTGSVRYEMMKEYYPQLYAKLKEYIAAGRWFVSGSSVDEGDVNVPSAESIIRHVLYGNQFFRREFGKESEDFMLPDCFGFPASMPSIWAHCGLKGFSTQKLTWGSAVGIPFKIGVWEGPDGKSVIAALDPGSYASGLKGAVQSHSEWAQRIEDNGTKYGVFADYHYYGVGDIGGAPREEDVINYVASSKVEDGPFKVALVSSDQMYNDITAEQRAKLPRYKGDMLLTEHSAGTLTSQAYMKRWNRKNEQLADAAERAAVAAHLLGAAEYPREKLYKCWVRVLGNQMHDILPGTSIPRAYRYSWNDEIVAMNGFAEVLSDSVGAVAQGLDMRVQGVPLVVYNPLAFLRAEVVEATVHFDAPAPPAVRVFGPDGFETRAQVLRREERSITLLFHARVPSVSFSVYDVRPAEAPDDRPTTLSVAENRLSNEQYVVSLNDDGDVASIIHTANSSQELLAAPHRLVFTHEQPANWPAWNMDWADRQKPPIDTLRGPAKVRIVENGPVRVALEVTREGRDSVVTQTIRLAAGEAGNRVEFATEIDWQSAACALRASFPLTASNPNATYNWEMGTIERVNNEPTRYEVPSHGWVDVVDRTGRFGVTILDDCKYGSDKPGDDEVRLTLLYTPGVRNSYMDQHSQDWGRHEMLYAVYGHGRDWREGRCDQQGRRLNQPLRAFQAPAHAGDLGKSWSLLKVNSEEIDVRAIKLDEDGHVIVRLQELWGLPARKVEVGLAANIKEAFEVDGQERRIGDAVLAEGRLVTDMTGYSPRSFALTMADQLPSYQRISCRSVALPFDEDIASRDDDRADGGLDEEGRTIPAEQLPSTVKSEGIVFQVGPTAAGEKNAVACRGQTIALPAGEPAWTAYLLAAATEDTEGRFLVDDKPHDLRVQSWTGFIGQWDDRVFDKEFGEIDGVCDGKVVGFNAGYIKRDPIAWFCTHRHHPAKGNEAYRFSYLFKYKLPLPPGAKAITLPNNPKIKIVALTLANNTHDDARPAAPLYDDFAGRTAPRLRHVYPPPPKPVFEGVTPTAKATTDRKDTFEALSMGAPSASDYADQAAGHDVSFRFIEGDGRWRPHGGAGAADGAFPRLNDGLVARNHDDTQRCVWYDGEGRFSVDLKKSVGIRNINTYSWHRGHRAPQLFSLWASNAEQMPPADFAAGAHEGWTLLAVVKTKDLGEGGMHGSSITAESGLLGPYRHLLWVSEDVGEGTFFTEIDIHGE